MAKEVKKVEEENGIEKLCRDIPPLTIFLKEHGNFKAMIYFDGDNLQVSFIHNKEKNLCIPINVDNSCHRNYPLQNLMEALKKLKEERFFLEGFTDFFIQLDEERQEYKAIYKILDSGMIRVKENPQPLETIQS